MLEKPDIPDERITAALRASYGIQASALSFLPLGADVNTAVYRASTARGADYFVKLRKGRFDDLSVRVPAFLGEQGIAEIIQPLETMNGALWARMNAARMDAYALILYPYIEGKNGYEQAMDEDQWRAFGRALKAVHATRLPADLSRRIAREDYGSGGRVQVRQFMAQVEHGAPVEQAAPFADPVAERLAAFMRAHRDVIGRMVERGEALGRGLRRRALDFVLCHADVHPGNILLAADGRIFLVDWDNPIYAPRERDLILIGGGSDSLWRSEREAALFYSGYGEAALDPSALAYYRYERIIQDIAEFCKALLLTDEGGDDREQSYGYFTGQFQPGAEVETALRGDPGV